MNVTPVELLFWTLSVAIMVVASYRVGMLEERVNGNANCSGPILCIGGLATIIAFIYAVVNVIDIAIKATPN